MTTARARWALTGLLCTLNLAMAFIATGCGAGAAPPSAAPPNAPANTAPAAATSPRDEVPADLRVSGPVVLRVHAQGFQVYTWQAGPDGAAAWKLKAPDATFSDGKGIEGKHYAGPTWECTTDGSKVAGRKLAEHASPDTSAVPWLLLAAKSHEGQGVLSNVTFIQRLNTTGGKAPVVDPAALRDNPPSALEARIPYTADYIFFGPGATTRPQ